MISFSNLHLDRRVFLGSLIGVLASVTAGQALAQTDPLPSWNDTAPKQAIITFVTNVTDQQGPDFVPVEERIAVFDMDGTLIPEQPAPAAAFPFLVDLKAALERDPSLATKPAIAALMAKDLPGVVATGEQGTADIIAAVTAGKTVEEAGKEMRALIADSKNPKFDRPLLSLGYQPMLELLSYLEANGFENWISSGSPVLFTRQLSERMFNIAPERVMGTNVDTRFVDRDGKSALVFGSTIDHINDGDTKPSTINLAIGTRPLLVGGNVRSVGDIAMMRYSKDRDGPSLQILINHDDAAREFAYGEPGDTSLNAAQLYGFEVVSMKDDWKHILAPR